MDGKEEVYEVLSQGEKVVAGMTYLYWSEGLPSEVYEARTKVPFDQDLLDLAIGDAIARHPYFGVRFEERDGDFYVFKNDEPLKAIRTDGYVPLGGHTNNYHLMGVTFTDEFVRLSFHHALTDGRGARTFFETLLSYYSDYANADDIDEVKTRHAELAVELSADEMKEPFGQKFEVEGSGEVEGLEKEGFHLAATDDKTGHRRYELRFSQDEFMAACKQIGATPIVMLSMMMCRGIKTIHPESDKPIISNFPADARQMLGCPVTYKNCVTSISLPYGEAQEALEDVELAASWRALLKAQTDYDYIAKQFNNMRTLLGLIGKVHSYNMRKKLLGRMENLSKDTFFISYVGRFDLPSELVSEVHLLGSVSSGLLLNMTCQDGHFVIDLLQDFESDAYFNALLAQFEQIGVSVVASEEILFETPRDELAEIITVPERLRDKVGEKLGGLAEAVKRSTQAAKQREARSRGLSAEISARYIQQYWDWTTNTMKQLDPDADLSETIETLVENTPSLFVR